MSKSGTVAIAGASGFIGQALIEALRPDYELIALSRTERPAQAGLIWRRCDLYSLLQAEAGLAGADYAVYLVHSPPAGARLTQGSFANLDLILADNFARAAAKAGVKQIVYLGHLLPGTGLSAYLRSRREVETVLGAYGPALTCLRTPVILGARGAAFELARTLVARLPVMLIPEWTRQPAQPLALSDAVAALVGVLGRAECLGRTYDLPGPETLAYAGVLAETSRQLRGHVRPMLPLPMLTPLLSRWGLIWLTGLPGRELLPLIESLCRPALSQDRELEKLLGIRLQPPAAAIATALAEPADTDALRRAAPSPYKDLRSVQRLPLRPGQTALWLSEAYARLMGGLLFPLLRAEITPDHGIRLFQRGLRKPLLQLDYAPGRSDGQRALFYINGGLLAQQVPNVPSRLEFRVMPGEAFAIAGIHDFRPRLPWYLYVFTQAYFHLWTMYAFIVWLRLRNR